MILESCQLLSAAWYMLDEEAARILYEDDKLCKKTHFNHPSAVWTRAHINNYDYVVRLAIALCNEWRYRYNHPSTKKHACEDKLQFLLKNPPPSIPDDYIPRISTNPLGFTLPMPQAMPDECKVNPDSYTAGAIACQSAYRKYYMSEHKYNLREWYAKCPQTNSRIQLDRPKWFVE